ncbi:MAG: F0F1 ATP synthase subunit B [Armatimonadota bacterium]
MGIFETLKESLHIEPSVVLAQSITFLVLLVLLVKFLYRPIQDVLQQRQRQIADSLSNADTEHQKAESLRKEYEDHLAKIADEARVRLDQAMKDAETARQRVLEKAQEEVHDLHQRQQAQLTLEREQLRRDLRAEMSDIAVMAAAKALRQQLNPTLHSAVIDQVISELDQQQPPLQ